MGMVHPGLWLDVCGMANDGQVMISIRNVSKVFPGSRAAAVGDLSLDINGGETVVLVGPSGCGKTTTMRMINRLIEPSSGTILVDGKDVMSQDPVHLRRGIGYVIQSIGLLPHRTVAQNIATVPKLAGWEEQRITTRVEELMGIFGLDQEMARRYPSELSGGQRQRVGVARALAVDPPVMLMDEPFAAVDPIVRARLQDQFLDIQHRLKKTIVFVTHDIDEAIKMADRIAILNVSGVLEQYAPPEEILRAPANTFVEEFVGAERGLKRLALIKVSEIGVD
jgi:osmoprotectant transport system ATP-binding protein